jgi:hypothetical protein
MTPKETLVDYKPHSNALSGVTMCANAGHVTNAQSEELIGIMYGRLAQAYSYDSQIMSSHISSKLSELNTALNKGDSEELAFFEKVCQQIPSMLDYNRKNSKGIKVPQFDNHLG